MVPISPTRLVNNVVRSRLTTLGALARLRCGQLGDVGYHLASIARPPELALWLRDANGVRVPVNWDDIAVEHLFYEGNLPIEEQEHVGVNFLMGPDGAPVAYGQWGLGMAWGHDEEINRNTLRVGEKLVLVPYNQNAEFVFAGAAKPPWSKDSLIRVFAGNLNGHVENNEELRLTCYFADPYVFGGAIAASRRSGPAARWVDSPEYRRHQYVEESARSLAVSRTGAKENQLVVLPQGYTEDVEKLDGGAIARGVHVAEPRTRNTIVFVGTAPVTPHTTGPSPAAAQVLNDAGVSSHRYTSSLHADPATVPYPDKIFDRYDPPTGRVQ